MKAIKKFWKILRWIFISAILFIIISSYLLSTTKVQTYLANVAVKWLNETVGLEAEIGRVELGFPNKVKLNKVYLADEHHDTLIYIRELSTTIAFNPKKNLLKTANVRLSSGKLFMRKYPEDSVFNFMMFLNKLSGGETTEVDSTSKPFQWRANSIEIDSMQYVKHRLGCTDTCTNIFIDYSKLSIKDFHLDGGYVSADIKSFVFEDRFRTDLIEFRALAEFQADHISAENLLLRTEQTYFEGDASLEYANLGNLSYFLDSVNMVAHVVKAEVSSDEFISWLKEFPDFGDMTLVGDVTGTVNDIHADIISASMGSGTHISGQVVIKNSTHANDIVINANSMYFHGEVADYNKYIAPLAGYALPEKISQLKYLDLNGSYNGDLEDIKIKGKIKTALGGGRLDISLSNLSNPDYMGYKGLIDLKDFDIGNFVNDIDIGKMSFKGEIDGSGTTTETVDFKGDLDIAYLEMYNYRLTNIGVDGRTTDSVFKGDVVIKDPNLEFVFSGLVDFKNENKKFDFKTELIKADLYKLGVSKDTISVVTTNVTAKLNYTNLNNFDGFLIVEDATYSDKDNFYFFDSITINSNYANQRHLVVLNSQMLNINLDGDFNILDIIPAIEETVSSMYKFYSEDENTELLNIDCAYKIEINNTDLLSHLFVPGLKVSPGTEINGHIKYPDKELVLNLSSPEIIYDDLILKNISFKVEDQGYFGNLSVIVKELEYDNVKADSSKIVFTLFKDSVAFKIETIIKDSIDAYVNIAGHSLNKKNDHYDVSLSRTSFNIGLQDFHIIGKNKISWYKEKVIVDNIFLKSDESNLNINGTLSDNQIEILRFSTDSFNMNILNYFIGDPKTRLSGFMNGDIMISEFFGSPKIIIDFRADSLTVNNDWVGDVKIESDWNYDYQQFEFNAKIDRGNLPAFNIDGIYKPDSNSYISAVADFNRFRVNSLSPLLDGILSDLRGTVTGGVIINGPLSHPSFSGDLTLSQVGMTVPYLSTTYNIVGQPKITILDTAFVLAKTEIRDSEENTKGSIFGSVNHHGFKDFVFDLEIEADKLLAMDLAKGEYEYFYGKGYASGNMTIKGPVEELRLDLFIKTEKGTEFNMPVTSNIEVEQNKFITFIDNGSVYEELLIEKIEDIDLRGLAVNINVDITTDATTRLIMDETVGDVISGTGKGQLRIKISPSGEIEMFGDYELEKGDYLFTMRNIINKPFELEPGGTMHWSGDPYNAQVNLRAKYSTRTTLTDMVTSGYDGQRVTVDLFLLLKGPLMNPTINFEIVLPGSSPIWQEELRNKLTNVDVLNQQAFSLLILNSFWTESKTNAETGQGISSNAYQMLSAQFSNWISAGTDFVDINMNYSTASQAGYQDEVEIGISKDFYDDRITVNGILDIPVGGTNSTQTNAQTFAGDVEVLYKITPDGRIRAKAFNRSNLNNPARDKLAAYTQGLGIQYQKDFETWLNFLHIFFGIDKAKKPEEEEAP